MSGARVQNIDTLKHFRIALWKFAESANVALGDAEGEVQRTVSWLQGEQQQFWTSQIRKRHEFVNRCKDAVRQKQLFKDSTGRVQSAVDELKALGIAKKKLEEAEQKLINTKRHSGKLQKELHMYKGAVQGFATAVASDLPTAVANLDRMVHSLEAYVSLTASSGVLESSPMPSSATAGSGDGNVMSRSDVEALAGDPVSSDENADEQATQAAGDKKTDSPELGP